MLIQDFLKMQRQAKELIHEKLGIPPTIRASVWESRYSEIKSAYESNPFAKVFFIHGLGVRIVTDDINIDFDYSLNGFDDGFDDWRIFLFAIGGDPSKWDSKGTLCKAFSQWFKEIETKGCIKMRDNLYYLSE